MARPRKSIRSANGTNEIHIELIKVIATTEEQKQKLVEARKLIAHFIGLYRSRKTTRVQKEVVSDAA